MYRRAIVRPPASNFAEGLTAANLGKPDYALAIQQHRAYCQALIRCGASLIRLSPETKYPDSTFVEDTAVVVDRAAVIMQPGAPSRKGEIADMITTLQDFFKKLDFIQSPGRIDGGDVCVAGDRLLVGLSERTNCDGAEQLAAHLSAKFSKSLFIDIKGINGILHLKSGMSYLGDDRLLVIEELADRCELQGLKLIRMPRGEEYASNCIRVGDHLIMPYGFPKTWEMLNILGYKVIEVNVSEFRKMDGGVSCLSIRF